MQRHLIRNSEQALLYITDCNLATVSDMAMKKSRPKHEFERQIEIAQCAVNWIKNFGINIEVNSRVYDVRSLPDQKVSTWASRYIKD